jgi:alpha-glucosidase
LRAGSATVEVTALAPDLFRVGLFAHGRSPSYLSDAVVERTWDPGAVTLTQDADALHLATAFATAHLSLNPLRIQFSDVTGRRFACDDPVLGMGWFPDPAQEALIPLANAVGMLGTPLRLYKQHAPTAHYFGCGERTGGLEKTGTRQVFWNTDPPPGHTALLNSLYVSIPFILTLDQGQAWGLFVDNTSRVTFDLAHEHPHRSWFSTDNGDLVYYVCAGPTPQAVVQRYTDLTGRTPLPPLWSLGNGQSRFSYQSTEEVLQIARTFRERQIPCDTLYLDIDTLDGYRVFTWDPVQFPDPAGLLAELRALGFHAVAIVDAGVKVDESFAVYTDGRARRLYCQSPLGTDYENAVWPGVCVFPDFTNPEARRWWGEQHAALLDVGIAGIWSDMNEPAVFLPVHDTLPAAVVHPGGGRPRLHTQVHNAYGSLMVQGAREGLLRLRPQQRPFIITRAGYAGVQRHALVWTGDNSATWEHLAMSLPQLLNLGLSGVAWSGTDIGGFYGDSNGELLARWTEFGIFQGFCRNHAEKQTRHQEPWVFGERYEQVCRSMLEVRMRLLPYLYGLFEECRRTGAPLLRPLFWQTPEDEETYGQDDEVLCGEALLVAPIVHAGQEYRHVYLPAGTWFHYWSGERWEGPAHILARAPLGEPAWYVRANTAVPLWPQMQYVGERRVDVVTLLVYAAEGVGVATWYEDAGDGYEQERGEYARREVRCVGEQGMVRVTVSEQEGTYEPEWERLAIEVRGVVREPQEVQLVGEGGEVTWRYEAERQVLSVELARTAQAIDLLIQW